MWNWLTIGKDFLAWQMSLATALYKKEKIDWQARIDSLIAIANKTLDKLGYEEVVDLEVKPLPQPEPTPEVDEDATDDVDIYDEL